MYQILKYFKLIKIKPIITLYMIIWTLLTVHMILMSSIDQLTQFDLFWSIKAILDLK